MCHIHVYWILLTTLSSVITVSSKDFFGTLDPRGLQDDPTLDKLLETKSDINYAKLSKASCRDEMIEFTTAIESGQTWAMHMLDASSKIQSGILMGNLMDIGMYDQCVGVHPQENVTDIQGRHCMYVLNIPLSTLLPKQFNSSSRDSEPKLRTPNPTIYLILSACVPSSCEGEDVQQIINDAIELVPKLKETGVTASAGFCSRSGTRTWGPGGIITLIFLLVLVLFLVLCTICEFMKRNLQFRSMETLSRFSLYTNAKTLLRTTSSQNFPVLNGLRCLSLSGVLLGHVYLLIAMAPLTNMVDGSKFADSQWARILNFTLLSVDTFLLISGFLVTYNFFKNMSQGATFNLSTYYIKRYIRLTPHVVLFILFSLYIQDLLGSGALWDILIGHCFKNCEDNWWLNLLYIQNYRGLNSCGLHLWYLAIDMQFFWLSPIILYPLYHWPKVGSRMLALLFAAAILTPAVFGAFYGFSTNLFRPDKSFLENVIESQSKYMPFYMRAMPWLIGVYLGYIIVDREKRVTRVQVVAGWLLTIIALAYCLFFCRFFQINNYEYNMVWEVVNMSMVRPLWAASIAWIIFASTHGYGGPIGTFLSLPVFVPMGRLSYSIYLVHLPIQIMRVASKSSYSSFSHIQIMEYFWSDLVVSTVIAFAFSLLFDAPFSVLREMFNSKIHRFQDAQTNRKVQ